MPAAEGPIGRKQSARSRHGAGLGSFIPFGSRSWVLTLRETRRVSQAARQRLSTVPIVAEIAEPPRDASPVAKPPRNGTGSETRLLQRLEVLAPDELG